MRYFVPTIHPAATFRAPKMLGPLQAHITGWLGRGFEGIPPDPRIYKNPSAAVLANFIRQVAAAKTGVSVDVEASPPKKGPPAWALLPTFARLRVVGIGAALGDGIGLSWTWPLRADVFTLLRGLLLAKKTVKVFMNGWGYDIPMLARCGLDLSGPVEDIRDGRRALVSTSICSLQHQASIYLRVPPWKAEALEDEGDERGYLDASRIPSSKILKYNALDCVYTAQIRKHQRREFKAEPDFTRRLYQHQKRLSWVAAEMSQRGFPVDEKRRRALSMELLEMAEKRKKIFLKLVQPYVRRGGEFRVNLKKGVNSNDLAALLFAESAKPHIKSFGLSVPYGNVCRTEKGAPSTSMDALLFLFAQDVMPPELKKIIYAAWQLNAPLKARSTYVDSQSVLGRIGPDGFLHSSINSCGTETGRWASSKPNLFNIPEAQTEDSGSLRGDIPNVRQIYTVPKKHILVHRDMKAFEVRVLAEYTRDTALSEMLNTGDVHTARARSFFGIPEEAPVPKGVRKNAKVVGLACQYHAGLDAVFRQVLEQIQDAVFSEVDAIYKRFPEVHTGIARHWETSLEFAQANGYNETRITGRRRYYPEGEDIKDTETSNYAIQGTAADIANCAMVGLEEKDYSASIHGTLRRDYPKAWLACHVYDSFDVICPEDQADEIDAMLDEKLQGPWLVGETPYRFASDGKRGKYWSDV